MKAIGVPVLLLPLFWSTASWAHDKTSLPYEAHNPPVTTTIQVTDDDLVKLTISPPDSVADTYNIKFCLQSEDPVSWWKGIKIHNTHDDRTVGFVTSQGGFGQKSCQSVPVTTFNPVYKGVRIPGKDAKVAFWKAKALGVHTNVAEAHFSYRGAVLPLDGTLKEKGAVFLFVWSKDAGGDAKKHCQSLYCLKLN